MSVLNIFLTIVTAVLSSGLVATLISVVFNYKLSSNERIMSVRREIYSGVHETLAGFFTTADTKKRQETVDSLLPQFRQVQLWGSDEVIKKFNKFLIYIDVKNGKPQNEVDKTYKQLILSMRKDLIDKKLDEEDLFMFGKIDS